MKIGLTPHRLLVSLFMDPQGPGQHTNVECTITQDDWTAWTCYTISQETSINFVMQLLCHVIPKLLDCKWDNSPI